MFLKEVTIKNYRAVQELNLEFKPGFNLLIGNNGAGKTSVLEAISVGLAGFLAGIDGVSAKSILHDDIHFVLNRAGDASGGIQYFTPVEIGCVAEIGGREWTWRRRRVDASGKARTTVEPSDIRRIAGNMANDMNVKLPLLSYQSEARVWQQKRGDFGNELKKKLNDRRCGYIGCLDYSLDIKGIREWCLKMELAAFQQKREIGEYEAFKGLVSSVMQRMSGLEERPVLYYDTQVGDIVYVEKGEVMPVAHLSAGYQSVLWMVMDLAYRLALLNPDAKEQLNIIPGIVLIDELDMHLHPRWQWNMISALEETFPRIQFIAATHSPIIISSCRHENLISINEARDIVYLPSAYGFSVNDILDLRLGSVEKPEWVRKLNRQFDEAMDQEDEETAGIILSRMKEALGEDHADVRSAEAELQLEDILGGEV